MRPVDRAADTRAAGDNHAANRRVGELVGKWTTAATALAKAPIVPDEGDVARVAAWLGGYVTDREVSSYLPLPRPVTMALVGALFWGVWG
jgi:hypothetical protein